MRIPLKDIFKVLRLYHQMTKETRQKSTQCVPPIRRLEALSPNSLLVTVRNRAPGWKTQDGRMTKQCRSHETVHSQSCVTFFCHFAVLGFPAVLLLRKLPIVGITKVILKGAFFLESTHFFMRLYYYRCC